MSLLLSCGLVLLIAGFCQVGGETGGEDDSREHTWKPATVLIAILARNKGHTLPYFLTYLSRLNYPKERISLWISSDHNLDHTIDVIEDWLHVYGHQYHSVFTELNRSSSDSFPNELGPAHWTEERYSWVIHLREAALNRARDVWADYFWSLDSDVFVTNPNALSALIGHRYVITAPMLRSEGLYSNFWCGMSPEFYYKRTDDYLPILYRKQKGCFSVPMVHSSVLVDLRAVASDSLTYDPDYLKGYGGPHDDIITFAISANLSGIEMKVCNQDVHGYVMMPLEKADHLEYDLFQLTNLKMEVLVENPPLEVDPLLSRYVRTPTYPRLSVDQIYIINLKRRHDRRLRMLNNFAELQLNVTIVDGVDGRPGFSLQDAIDTLVDTTDSINAPIDIFVEPPEPAVLTDEDSGNEEDEELDIRHFPGAQLMAAAEIVGPGGRIGSVTNDAPPLCELSSSTPQQQEERKTSDSSSRQICAPQQQQTHTGKSSRSKHCVGCKKIREATHWKRICRLD